MNSTYTVQTILSYGDATGTLVFDKHNNKVSLHDNKNTAPHPDNKFAVMYYRENNLCLNLTRAEKTPRFVDGLGQDMTEPMMIGMLEQGIQMLGYTKRRSPTIYINQANEETYKLVGKAIAKVMDKPAKAKLA